jgi:hypothetical protein
VKRDISYVIQTRNNFVTGWNQVNQFFDKFNFSLIYRIWACSLFFSRLSQWQDEIQKRETAKGLSSMSVSNARLSDPPRFHLKMGISGLSFFGLQGLETVTL